MLASRPCMLGLVCFDKRPKSWDKDAVSVVVVNVVSRRIPLDRDLYFFPSPSVTIRMLEGSYIRIASHISCHKPFNTHPPENWVSNRRYLSPRTALLRSQHRVPSLPITAGAPPKHSTPAPLCPSSASHPPSDSPARRATPICAGTAPPPSA